MINYELQERLARLQPNENVLIAGEEFDVKFNNGKERSRINLDTGFNHKEADEMNRELKELKDNVSKAVFIGEKLKGLFIEMNDTDYAKDLISELLLALE